MEHSAIQDAVLWALNNVAEWSSNKTGRGDRVAKFGKAVQLGCDYTEGEMAMITALQVLRVCKFDQAHAYVNVRHKLYKRGL